MNRGELYWQRPVPAHPLLVLRPEASQGQGQPCAKRRPRCTAPARSHRHGQAASVAGRQAGPRPPQPDPARSHASGADPTPGPLPRSRTRDTVLRVKRWKGIQKVGSHTS